jgi:hypothetical protein
MPLRRDCQLQRLYGSLQRLLAPLTTCYFRGRRKRPRTASLDIPSLINPRLRCLAQPRALGSLCSAAALCVDRITFAIQGTPSSALWTEADISAVSAWAKTGNCRTTSAGDRSPAATWSTNPLGGVPNRPGTGECVATPAASQPPCRHTFGPSIPCDGRAACGGPLARQVVVRLTCVACPLPEPGAVAAMPSTGARMRGAPVPSSSAPSSRSA